MLSNESIAESLKSAFKESDVEVSGDGYHYQVSIVSDEFVGLNKVKRQQAVYKVLNQAITSGALHAISISALTVSEQKERQDG
jgi:acid stress-induced BolA-like protein IbaG/YrbA